MRRRRRRGRCRNRGPEHQRAIVVWAPHPERRVRRLGVVVREPATNLGQHRFGIPQLGAVHVVPDGTPIASIEGLVNGEVFRWRLTGPFISIGTMGYSSSRSYSGETPVI